MIDKAQKTKMLMENFNNYLKKSAKKVKLNEGYKSIGGDKYEADDEYDVDNIIQDNYPEVGDEYYIDYSDPLRENSITVYEGNENSRGDYLCKIYIKKIEESKKIVKSKRKLYESDKMVNRETDSIAVQLKNTGNAGGEKRDLFYDTKYGYAFIATESGILYIYDSESNKKYMKVSPNEFKVAWVTGGRLTYKQFIRYIRENGTDSNLEESKKNNLKK